jgi:outer membrane protein OmpA-like peptidoglycan-associated protein
MQKRPTLRIRIESHSDAIGNDDYNMKLSERRAKATQSYIILKGIDASRIESAIGYGESRLINGCSNGIDQKKNIFKTEDPILLLRNRFIDKLLLKE